MKLFISFVVIALISSVCARSTKDSVFISSCRQACHDAPIFPGNDPQQQVHKCLLKCEARVKAPGKSWFDQAVDDVCYAGCRVGCLVSKYDIHKDWSDETHKRYTEAAFECAQKCGRETCGIK